MSHHRLEQGDEVALEADVGLYSQALCQRLHVLSVVEAPPEHGELLVEELGQRDSAGPPQRMLLPHHHQHLFPQQLGPLERRRQVAGNEDGEIQAAVHHATQ